VERGSSQSRSDRVDQGSNFHGTGIPEIVQMMRRATINGADNAIDDACQERVVSPLRAAEDCHGFASTVTISKSKEPSWL